MADLDKSLEGAANALNNFAHGPVQAATDTIERSVARSFAAVSNTIARATVSGRDSIAQLTGSILADFERIATRAFIVRPISGIINSLAGSLLPVAGARAAGGPVAPGAAYLVGEHGPELFTPSGHGAITPGAAMGGGRPVQVTMNISTPDAASFQKSGSQVAAMMARAIAQGNRNL